MTAPRTPIRSANDPPPTPNPSSEESGTPPNPNPNPSDGPTEEEQPPAGDPPSEDELTRMQRYTGILEETLREQNRTIQRLNESRPAAPPPAPPPPPPDPAVERQDFYNNPVEATRRTIRQELQETVAPLLEFVKEMKGQGATGKFKDMVKNDARFSGMWDAAVERAVDEALTRVAPDQINEGTVRAAAVQAIGLKAMGLLEGATPPAPPSNGNGNPPPAGDRRVPASPPHMRPSAPPAPSGRPAPKLRDLTENEERLRRENKMTKEDFLWWLEQPAGEVTKGTPPSQRGRA